MGLQVVAFEIDVAADRQGGAEGAATEEEDINLVHLRVQEEQRLAAEASLRRALERRQLMTQVRVCLGRSNGLLRWIGCDQAPQCPDGRL